MDYYDDSDYSDEEERLMRKKEKEAKKKKQELFDEKCKFLEKLYGKDLVNMSSQFRRFCNCQEILGFFKGHATIVREEEDYSD